MPVPSAQVKSAVLLCGLNAPGITRVEEPEATRDHSENMLRHFGATVQVEPAGSGRVITLHGQPELRAADVVVPGDPSSAAFLVAAALLVPGSRLTIEGVGLNQLRCGLSRHAGEMGADIAVENRACEGGEPVGDLVVTHGTLRGVDVPPERAPSMIDEYPILAVVAARRGHHAHARAEGAAGEGERPARRHRRAAGGERRAGGDRGRRPDRAWRRPAAAGGGLVATHMDHRMAMSALVLGLATEQPVAVDDAGFIDTSFPGSSTLMNGAGAALSPA